VPRFGALIFDMDGVLVDTEPLHVRAWTSTLQGFDPAAVYEERGRLVGMSSPAIAVELIRQFKLDTTAEELLVLKRSAYRGLLRDGIEPFGGLREELARWHHVSRALATSSTRSETRYMLDLIDLAEAFCPVVTSDDVAAAKPAPDTYLLAARLLGLPPAACVVIEDSPNGMTAALRAGTSVLAVSSEPPAGLPEGVLRSFASTVAALQWLRACGREGP
jgi:HAD superfamily hydrolase (TIGR01509 family)